ncbi:hypothetical protein AB5I41_12785 [Sphingomonas sp. MMS24-JH45]
MTITRPILPLLALTPLLVSAQAPDGAGSLDGTRYAQVIIRERIVVRIPRVGPAPVAARGYAEPPPAATPVWIEKKAPDCVPVAKLTGASVDRDGEVDLIVQGTKRLRAKLDDDCPTLDFYSGFYLRQASDGRICARRDLILLAVGARCAITGFRTLALRK